MSEPAFYRSRATPCLAGAGELIVASANRREVWRSLHGRRREGTLRGMAITSSASGIGRIESILGEEAEDLLGHECTTIARDRLHLPGPDFVDRVVKDSDRPTPVLRSLQSLFGHGRLAGTGYVSILPVDQGIEHSAGASFAKNPDYFDPDGIVKLAIEGGCNAVASTLGVLGAVARRYAHRIPFMSSSTTTSS